MAEASPPIESAEIGADQTHRTRKLDKGFRRNLIIIGAVAGIAVLVLAFIVVRGIGGKKDLRSSKVELGMQASSAAPGNLTPAMLAKLEAKQRDESRIAAESNQSYVPPDAPPVVPVPSAQGSAYARGSVPVTRASNEADARRRDGLTQQLAALVSPALDGGVRQSIHAAGAASAPAVPASAASAPSNTGNTLIAGLQIVAAELTSDLEIATGSQGFASARITSGPAAGAFLVGSAHVVGEGLEITFNQMRLGDKVYPISAIALDEGTASNAVSSNVDRRLLQRYVFPVVLAMAQGFYNATSQTGSTVVGVGNSTEVGVATPAPTSEQARAAGAAAGLSLAQREVQRAAQAPIIVSRGKNYPVGILFRTPVYQGAGK